MKSIGYTSTLLTPLLLLFHFCASAQGVVFTASAGTQKIGLDDQVEVSFVIHNATNIVGMCGGQMKDFIVIAGPYQNSSSSTSSINGRTSQSMSVSFTYVLQPRHTGNLTISPGVAKDGAGNIYQSNSLVLNVVKGSVGNGFGATQRTPPPAQQQQRTSSAQGTDFSKELILKAVAEKSTVHAGEQVTIKWKLYHRVPLRDGSMKMPLFTGVYSQNLDSATPERQVLEVLNGRKYAVDVVKKVAVFPQQAGDLVIDPAIIDGYVPVEGSGDNNPFNDPVFQQMGMGLPDPFGTNVPVSIKSEPLTLHVLPLSTIGQPQNYTGAVGSFLLKSTINKTELTTDDIITLTLLIEGRGNFKLFAAPKLNLPKGFSAYDPTISDSIAGKGDEISGIKTVTYSISPQLAGDYTIPAQTFTYFNPQTAEYETASTTAHNVHIRPGRQSEHGVKGVALTQIHDIDTKLTGDSNGPSTPLIYKSTYWVAHASPLLAFAGLLLYRRRKERFTLDTPEARKKRARNIAVAQLAKSRDLLEQGVAKPYYEAVSWALWHYLSNKLSLPASQLSRSAVMTELIQQGVPGTTLQELSALLDECDSAIYAPGGAQQMTEVYRKAAEVITSIEAASIA